MTENNNNCPTCGKSPVSKYRPFCSRRCADIDLGRWFNESYRVPGEEAPHSPNGSGESVDEE